MRLLRRTYAYVVVAALAACAGPGGDVVIAVPPHIAVSTPSVLSRLPAMTVDVRDLREPGGTGVLPGRVGERKTIGDISMGLVTVTPLPGQVMAEMLEAELKAAGHRIGADGASAVVEGEIRRFDLRTDVTALYWDVIGTTSVSVTVVRAGQSATGQYTATCQERTYVWPSSDMMARVVSACLDDIARQFREDANVAHALGG